MSPFELYAELTRRGVVLWADHDRLRYRAARGAMDESLRAQLVENKETIYRLFRNGATDVQASYPLSHAQRALWFLYKLDPQSAAYNTVLAARVHSAVDVAALGRAFTALAERHHVLRSTYAQSDLGPMQHIHAGSEFSLSEIDGSRWSEKRVEQWLGDEARRPFDLEQGPIWRASFVRQSGQQGVLLLVVHHIAIDVMSYMVLIDELRELYPAARMRTASKLAAPEAQYSDHVLWQAEYLSGAEGGRLLDFWRERLAGKLPVVELPTDRPRPPLQTYRGASHLFFFDKKLISALRTLADSERATLQMALLTAFAAVLHRYSGQEEMIIGSPTTGRTEAKFARVVGLFANLVALRLKVSAESDFKTLLKQVRQAVNDAQAHQGYPFPYLVERLQPQRDPSRTPLFQITFTLDRSHWLERAGPAGEAGEPGVDVGGLQLVPMIASEQEGQFDLAMQVIERGDSFSAYLKYNTDLFDADTIARMAGHYLKLLEGAVAEPGCAVWALPLLTEAERTQICVEWNRTETGTLHSKLVHEAVEMQAARVPENIAAVFKDQILNYSELNRRANQLAHFLRSLGVGPDTLVGICVERSLEMVIGLLGILKAGGAYVPLDPDYPPDRIAFMLADSQTPLLLTQQHLLGQLPPDSTRLVCLDRDWPEIARHSDANPTVLNTPEDLAYVIYTSGSTGRPKGVAVPHKGVHNRLEWMQAAYGLTQNDRVLQKTPFSFDVSVWEFFWTWAIGARLVLAIPNGHRDNGYLAELIQSAGITVLHFVPSMLGAFLEMPEVGACRSLRCVIVSGEALSVEFHDRFFARLGGAELHNLYGPTEASIDVTAWACKAAHRNRSVPIGRPIANMKVYVLDGHQQPVPVGVPGELYLGGVGLARGYVNRPELTAERFVPDPFGKQPGARLYKTGDLVRYRPDGAVEFLGRLDHQVKLRGFRIELGEIEAVLARHPAVRDQVVVCKETNGENRLVAYVVLGDNSPAVLRDLPESLKTQLPAYMVPSVFVPMPSLPLNSNGKVDRRALPEPASTRPEFGEAFAPPRDALEQLVAEAYAAILGLDRVGIHDNFFELGGHSLLAIQLRSRLRQAAGIDLPLHALFEAPTVAGLAEKAKSAGQISPDGPKLIPMSGTGSIPLSFAQERLWVLERLSPGTSFYNIPEAFRLIGPLDREALLWSFEEVLQRHEILRSRIRAESGKPVQQIADAAKVRLETADLRTLPASRREDEAWCRIRHDAVVPFDLEHGPLFRVTVIQLDDKEHWVLLTVHHIVADGWSMGVLVKEITALYNAAVGGQRPSLPPLPVQYADYALWQRQWFQGEIRDRQLSYWRKQLSGEIPILQLPTDRVRPAVQSYRGSRQSFSFPPSLHDSLQGLAQREGATLFMTLLAGFVSLLHKYSGQPDIVVGTPTANRNRSEVEGLIGLFLNMLVLRTDLSGEPSFRELLARVRRMALEAYAHEDMPFEQLVEDLQPQRDRSRAPLFQVLFILQNVPQPALQLSGLEVRPLEVHTATSKFDLTVSLAESQGTLVATWEYNTDIFEAVTVARMAGHYIKLLEGAVAEPGRAVWALPVLTEAEKTQLCVEWNRTETEMLQSQLVHELLERQTERTPERTAVIFEDESLSYAELNRRANQLAGYLRTLGVGPETLVGVSVERSVEMLVAVLGVLKAGGAYVPLDPSHPQERLAMVLEDCGAKVLLTQARLVARLPAHSAHVVCLDLQQEAITQASTVNPGVKLKPESLAYVMYTSGSTGRPKGVQIPHGAVVNLLDSMSAEPGLNEDDVLLAVTNLSFDIAGLELFLPLSVGAKIVIANSETCTNGPKLAQLLTGAKVTVMQATPVTWRLLLGSGWLGNPRLKILCGGEAFPRDLAEALLAKSGEVWNMYGPTETTIWSTVSRVCSGKGGVSIGRPIANTEIFVLDTHQQLVPVGVWGELHIGGRGLARGYLNRAELTAERFIASPFAAGQRLYKTGDLVRYLADGNLDFQGRMDDQVKLRGFRIELGEIETALAGHPAVRHQAVAVRTDGSESRLVAYVVLEGDESVLTELQGFLRTKLPTYMVPTVFVPMKALPVTPNGKIDRRALPAPAPTRPELAALFVPPRNPIEQVLAQAYATVLGLDRVGIHDNFFELGGASLSSLEITAKLHEAGIPIPPESIFEYQTIAELAAVIESMSEGKALSPLPQEIAR